MSGYSERIADIAFVGLAENVLEALGRNSYAVIFDLDYIIVSFSIAPEPDGSALGAFADAVLDCVLNERLYRERRYAELCFLDIVFYVQSVAEPYLFYLYIAPDMLDLRGEGDSFEVCQVVYVCSQIVGEIVNHLVGNVGVDFDEGSDRRQCVEHKMRLDLSHHELELAVVQELLRRLALERAVVAVVYEYDKVEEGEYYYGKNLYRSHAGPLSVR